MLNELKKLGSLYGVEVYKSKKEYSYALCWEGKIYIRPRKKRIDKMISSFFHELAHIVCTVEGKYINYHLDLKGVKFLKKLAVRAEKYVDKRGEELMKIWYPEYKYIPSYQTKEDFDWLRKFWDKD